MATKKCTHHWIVEEPDGSEEAPAECKLCGITTTFLNSGNRRNVWAGRDGKPKRGPHNTKKVQN